MSRSRAPTAAVQTDELASVRAALVELAWRDASRVLAAADEDAAGVLAEADGEVERIKAAARAEAADDVAQLVVRQEARHDREARAVELRARRAAYDELLGRARLAADELAHEPAVHDRLVVLARSTLGPAASVRDDRGGVVAELAGRRVEYSLEALADRAVAELLAEREEQP